jgi:hypothetical protein
MALTNFAGSISEAFGGWLFEAGEQAYNEKMAFSLAVLASVAAAMSCRLVFPVLRRVAPQWWERRI